MNTRYHFVREIIDDGTMKIEFVKSENNDSDIFTKNLGRELDYEDKSIATRDGQHETDTFQRKTRNQEFKKTEFPNEK